MAASRIVNPALVAILASVQTTMENFTPSGSNLKFAETWVDPVAAGSPDRNVTVRLPYTVETRLQSLRGADTKQVTWYQLLAFINEAIDAVNHGAGVLRDREIAAGGVLDVKDQTADLSYRKAVEELERYVKCVIRASLRAMFGPLNRQSAEVVLDGTLSSSHDELEHVKATSMDQSVKEAPDAEAPDASLALPQVTDPREVETPQT